MGDVTPQGQARVEANSLSKISLSKIQNRNQGRLKLSTKIGENKSSEIHLNHDIYDSLKIQRSQHPMGESHIIMNNDEQKIFSFKKLLLQTQRGNIELDSAGGDIILRHGPGKHVKIGRGGHLQTPTLEALP